MQAYSKLLNSLIRLGSIKVPDIMGIIDEIIGKAITELNNKLLYIVYSWNSTASIEVYFNKLNLTVRDNSIEMHGDKRSVEDISRLIVRRMLIGDGKRVVMIFRDEGDYYIKVPTKPEFSITINPAVSFIASSILTLIILLLLTRYSIPLTLAAVALQVIAVNVMYTYISFSRMSKIKVNGLSMLKVTTILPINVPEDVLFRVVSYASSIRRIRKDELDQVVRTIRAIGGPAVLSIDIERVSIPQLSNINIYLVPSPECNAVSLNLFSKIIVISTKLIACLSQGELEAVVNHEVGHIVNLDTYRALLTSLIYSLASAAVLIYVVPMIESTMVSLAIYASIIFVAIVFSMALSRLSEIRADLYALSKGYREQLATALVKVTYPYIHSIPLKTLFLSHPSTLSRINRLLNAPKGS